MPFIPASDPAAESGSGNSGSGAGSPHISTAAADLVEARDRLLATGNRGGHRLDAPALRHALVDLFDFWLTAKGAEVGVKPGSGFSIVAVGGLGRREMLPYSDLDLILLHDNLPDAQVSEVADAIWYPLWDAHIKLDHSVRTVPQALRVAGDDMTAALGLLEARHIAGDEDLSGLLIGGVRRQWRADIRSRFGDLVAQTHARWRRSGDIAHRAEPDLKHGRGGLRDVQLLGALAIGQLTDQVPGLRPDSPGAGLSTAYTRILDIRTELHRISGRAREQLQAQDADEIGAALRIGDRFELARSVSDCARTITYSVDVGLRTAGNTLPRRGLSRLRRNPVRRPLDEGVVEHLGEVVLARGAVPAKDPGLVLRVASASARTGMPISAATLARLADTAPELREPWPPEALNDLLVLLETGHHMLAPIEALDRTGLWGRLMPEWGAVRDLPPRDAMHTWTVDRHLVETAAYASALTTEVSRPDLLVLGALIHDIGKGRGGDHSIVGAELAVQIGRRLGLPADDVEVLSQLVRHHLLLPIAATRRDPDDPRTVQSIVDATDGNPELLELLGALSEADSKATGPGVWSDWKASLIANLVRRGCAQMEGRLPAPPEPLSETQLAAARAGQIAVEIAPAIEPVRGGTDRHTFRVTMIAPDGPGVLSKMAGVLALAGLRSLSATVQGDSGSAVNSFIVVPLFGDPPAVGLLRQQLISVLSGSPADLRSKLDAKERQTAVPVASRGDGERPGVPALFAQASPKVTWTEGPDGAAIVGVRADDRVGLLSRVAAAIERAGGDIVWARAQTRGAAVIDAFCLAGPYPGEEMRSRMAHEILAAVPGLPPKPVAATDADDPDQDWNRGEAAVPIG
ncbi:[protein-PII] uridylyltransferase [Jongsikchunia kroppenstedtii]|uniref:[protein-PII] uridylyltransferase n=1 Tax=Jongsikchunia kroppenstedtii TaxID=1121721 RepID=UPI00036F6886|nr:[protein-PII] uridylyltransferase [Jongsikchunia kroppenstedtii]